MYDKPEMTGMDMSMVFAALADPTRLALIETLSDGESRSIVVLSQNGSITRQAVTKHLSVLEQANLVEREKVGRESRFRLHPAPLIDARLSRNRFQPVGRRTPAPAPVCRRLEHFQQKCAAVLREANATKQILRTPT